MWLVVKHAETTAFNKLWIYELEHREKFRFIQIIQIQIWAEDNWLWDSHSTEKKFKAGSAAYSIPAMVLVSFTVSEATLSFQHHNIFEMRILMDKWAGAEYIHTITA